jgi:hypothetical protein
LRKKYWNKRSEAEEVVDVYANVCSSSEWGSGGGDKDMEAKFGQGI